MSVVYSNERRAGWLRGSDRKKKKKRTTMTMKNKGRQLALSIKVATMREREDERATAGCSRVCRARIRTHRQENGAARRVLLAPTGGAAEAEDKTAKRAPASVARRATPSWGA